MARFSSKAPPRAPISVPSGDQLLQLVQLVKVWTSLSAWQLWRMQQLVISLWIGSCSSGANARLQRGVLFFFNLGWEYREHVYSY